MLWGGGCGERCQEKKTEKRNRSNPNTSQGTRLVKVCSRGAATRRSSATAAVGTCRRSAAATATQTVRGGGTKPSRVAPRLTLGGRRSHGLQAIEARSARHPTARALSNPAAAAAGEPLVKTEALRERTLTSSEMTSSANENSNGMRPWRGGQRHLSLTPQVVCGTDTVTAECTALGPLPHG